MRNPILNRLTRLRRNHALEHATLQVLGQHGTRSMFAGYSDWNGFLIFGPINTEELMAAVEEALLRLKQGESSLAIHPACGTNFVFAGAAAGSLVWLSLLKSPIGWKQKLERWPVIVAIITLALLLVHPIGPRLQANLTTQPNPGSLSIKGIYRICGGRVITHRITTIS